MMFAQTLVIFFVVEIQQNIVKDQIALNIDFNFDGKAYKMFFFLLKFFNIFSTTASNSQYLFSFNLQCFDFNESPLDTKSQLYFVYCL
jgi:hypothetical protein